MISKLEIKNFQSHTDTEMDFCKGLNVIIGDTDSGKSAIIRAIRLLALNKPLGDKFVNWNIPKGESLFIKTIFDDGSWVIREKNKKENKYNASGYTDSFSALKGKVPKEIQEITKLSESNIQSQSEYYFLLDKTGGQVASAFNQVANLGLMESVLKEIKSRITENNSKIGYEKENKNKLKNEIENLGWIEKAKLKFRKLEAKEILFEENKDKVFELEELLTSLDILDSEINDLSGIETVLQQSTVILSLHSSLIKGYKYADTLSRIISEYTSTCSEIKAFKSFKKLSKKAKKILQNKEKIDIRTKEYKDLSKTISLYRKNRKKIKTHDQEISEIKKEIFKFNNKVKMCPLCGSKL